MLLDMESLHALPPQVVFERRGLRGFPVFAVLVDDIPEGMALRQAGNYMIDLFKNRLNINGSEIKKQELIKLQDGIDANYAEIRFKYLSRKIYSVGVFAYKHNKIISVVAGDFEETTTENLAAMVKSLKFEK
jgi:hypothetical protein